MKRTLLCCTVILLFLAGTIQGLYAGKPSGAKGVSAVSKVAMNDMYYPMLINNVFTYYSNNGSGSWNPYTATMEGFEVPKGKNLATVIYQDGTVWGCLKQGTLHVGGSTYWFGLQAGPILLSGNASTLPTADDPSNPANRLYRVRRDLPPIPGVTDPDDPAAAVELANVQSTEVPLIIRYQSGITAEQLLQQYWNDWNAWPANEGAIFTDVDHDGSYNPSIDIPGVPYADQTMWYVANDLDASRVNNFSGSTPIGIEMQKTIWAFNRGGALGNTIFTTTRIINKSGVELDSMYIGQWSDPDLGNPGDDYVGCDTLLSLGYDYNGYGGDTYFQTYGYPPPAAGYHFFQGPVVPGSATDTAIFEMKYRPGYKNLPMTSFNFFVNGNNSYTDPPGGGNGGLQGTTMWYRLLKGLMGNTGTPYVNPTTGRPTTFVFTGDPVNGTGWLNRMVVGPSDARMAMSSGPFTMMPGDTQEVVLACMAAYGPDYLSSVTALKAAVRTTQVVYHDLFTELPPTVSSSVRTSGSQATVSIQADSRSVPATGIVINLRTYSDALVASASLADDGLHGDGASGDKIFGNTIQIAQQAEGLYAEAVITYPNGKVLTWPHLIDNITTTSITAPAYSIASDNINEDGTANPGENVRYTFTLKNNSSFTFSNLSISANPVFGGAQLSVTSLNPNASSAFVYDQNNPATYLAFQVPKVYSGSSFKVALEISDLYYDQWIDTLTFPAAPLGHNLYGSPVTFLGGNAKGSFAVWIVDSSKVTNHLYVVHGVDSIAPGPTDGYTLVDSILGTTLIQNHPLPDMLGHTSPTVDGFKLLLGSIDTLSGMRSWSVPSGNLRFSPVGGYNGLGLEGFTTLADSSYYNRGGGTIGMGGHFLFGEIGTTLTNQKQYHTVLLRLAQVDTGASLWDPRVTPADTNYSRAYRYLLNAHASPASPSFAQWIIDTVGTYPYQDFNYAVPFSAWDMEQNPPVRLAVGMMEDNISTGFVDGRYWPPVSAVESNWSAAEVCFIFNKPYSTTPDPALQIDFHNQASTPLMWVMTCDRADASPWRAGDQFEIVANHLPGSQDEWMFNTSVLTNVKQAGVPYAFRLMQNYPNPFNPSTTIRYELPFRSRVLVTVYDLLGRRVASLFNGVQNEGGQSLMWNGRSDAGISVASGVYFYRLEATNSADPGARYVLVKKMLLLR
ncbi:MAG TPA: FlgD immunoglobulin-like domain containing protein [Bacteroidota bacterium]|nr:FlgD immunoglobulin-like domain containing protein [Bacteroidota bacterium]